MTLWTVAYQALPSMRFSRQEYWSGLPFPSPGNLPDPGIEPGSPSLEADALTSEPPEKSSTAVSKANGCNEIPAELFKSLKDDATKVLHSLCQQIWKSHQCHKTGKGQSSLQSSRRVVPKNMLTIRQLHSSPMLVRSCLKSYVLGFSIM